MSRQIVPQNYSLRPVTEEDHVLLISLHNDPEVLRNLKNDRPITFGHHMSWWNRVSHDPKEKRLIFFIDAQRIGFTKFYDIDAVNRSCVLGADIEKSFRGKGLAKHMWSLMLDHCFNDTDLNRVSLTTAEFNVIGQRVYRNLGFIEEGRHIQALFRDGKFHDEILMYMLRDQWVT